MSTSCPAWRGASTEEGTRRVRRTLATIDNSLGNRQSSIRQSTIGNRPSAIPSVSVRLAVAAVIARHAGLDDAGAVGGGQVVLVVARVRRQADHVEELRRAAAGQIAARLHPRDRLAHQGAKCVLVHAPTSTTSTMPMIAASTAANFRPSACPAAFPSITTSTFSPMPAPTESIASSVVPRGVSSRVSGCTSSSLAPSSLRFFCVATTVPTTRAICTLRQAPVIDDADDGGVGGRLGGIERKRRFAAADEEDVLADAGADRVERDQRAPRRLARCRQRLQHEQLDAVEVRVLHGRYNFADDSRQLHVSALCPALAASPGALP